MNPLLFTIDSDAEIPVMMLTNFIGIDKDDDGNIKEVGIVGAQFAKELYYLDTLNKKSIRIKINTPGGSITDGMEIYDAINKTKTPVDTENIGMAASMGAVIFEGGRKRIMNDYAILMFHNPQGVEKEFKNFKQSLITMICSKSGVAEDVMSKMMSRETWINAVVDGKENEDFKGLWDEIIYSKDVNKIRKPQFANAIYKEYSNIVNSIYNQNNNTMDKKALCQKLGLAETSTDEQVIAAIDAAINNATNKKNEETDKKVKALEAEIDELKKQLKAAKKNEDDKEVDKCNNKIKALEDKIKKMEEDAAEDKRKAEEDKTVKAEEDKKNRAIVAENYINKQATAGRLQLDKEGKIMNFWKEQYVADEQKTISAIEALPINKVGVDIKNLVLKDKDGKDILPSNANSRLAQIKVAHDAKYKN